MFPRWMVDLYSVYISQYTSGIKKTAFYKKLYWISWLIDGYYLQ